MTRRVPIAAALVAITWAPSALAQGAPVAPAAAPSIDRAVVEQRGPNLNLIVAGASTFGVLYAISVGVAVGSDSSADDYLYAPLVGPWIDLANRPSCVGNCTNETLFRALLIADGSLQAAGTLLVIGGLVFPKTRLVPAAIIGGTRVNFTPVAGGGTLGVAANGKF